MSAVGRNAVSISPLKEIMLSRSSFGQESPRSVLYTQVEDLLQKLRAHDSEKRSFHALVEDQPFNSISRSPSYPNIGQLLSEWTTRFEAVCSTYLEYLESETHINKKETIRRKFVLIAIPKLGKYVKDFKKAQVRKMIPLNDLQISETTKTILDKIQKVATGTISSPRNKPMTSTSSPRERALISTNATKLRDNAMHLSDELNKLFKAEQKGSPGGRSAYVRSARQSDRTEDKHAIHKQSSVIEENSGTVSQGTSSNRASQKQAPQIPLIRMSTLRSTEKLISEYVVMEGFDEEALGDTYHIQAEHIRNLFERSFRQVVNVPREQASKQQTNEDAKIELRKIFSEKLNEALNGSTVSDEDDAETFAITQIALDHALKNFDSFIKGKLCPPLISPH